MVHQNATSAAAWARPVSEEGVFPFISLNVPIGFVRLLAPALLLAYLGCVASVAVRLGRGRRIVDLAPVGSLVLTQALWFLLPSMLLAWQRDLPALIFGVIWISAAHSVQYLWVSSYFAKQQTPSLRMHRYLGRALLAGAAVVWLPGLVFAPAALGSVPWTSGLSILLFSVVNLHHFVLDGAIWKLRDGRVARFLLRSASDATAGPDGRSVPRSGWLRPLLATAGAVAVAIAAVDIWEREVGINRSQHDFARMREAADRLALIGRASPEIHAELGAALARQNRLADSVDEFERSLEIYPSADAYFGLGVVLGAQGAWQAARTALDEALARRPNDLNVLMHSSRTWVQLGRPDLARRELERARALAPTNPEIRRALARVPDASDGES